MRLASTRLLAWTLPLLVAVVCSGCGGGPDLTPVEGVVTLDGDPVEGAAVLFEPVDGGPSARGVTDASGKFVLTTVEEGDGAQVGLNKVSVAKAPPPKAGGGGEEEGHDPDEVIKHELPIEYASPRTTPLEIAVKSGMEPVKIELVSD